ncbi:MAG TPA: D-alanine--D-alanine ligase family protein [Solirubrobacterales bacterium]|nr:D-alanine--D-alanine ligase family protein [Solirubrobacterales bacterium]
MRVAVLGGGTSSEHEVSLRSAASVAAGLREAGHETVEVTIGRDGRWTAEGEGVEITPGAGLLGSDVVFPVLHGPGGEDGSVQGLLEVLDVPYAGSDVESSAICMDKLVFKDLLAQHGIPQVEYCRAGEEGWREITDGFGRPVWVKPARLGSSVGITPASGEEELDRAVEQALRHDPRVIVEAPAPGKEVECSLLGNEQPAASPPGEIVTKASDWYDYEAKYAEGGMELRVPAEVSESAREAVRELARSVFTLCGCSGLARCDFFVDGEDVLVNELNTIPGFTETSVYGKLFEADGIGYPELCDRLVELAIERYETAKKFQF